MPYYVYMIATEKNSKITTYVGYTNNLKKRLEKHNKGKGAKFTRGRLWKIIYSEKFTTKKNKTICTLFISQQVSYKCKAIVNIGDI